jgi:hypothetical protein
MFKYVLFGGSGSKAQWCLLFLLLLSGLTTDIFESPSCALFLGVVIRCLASGSAMRAPRRSPTPIGARGFARPRNAADLDVYELRGSTLVKQEAPK